MASRLIRAWLPRASVAAAVVALPLFGAGAAQAAIAGANPEKTNTVPDLVSATVLSSNSVDFCYDRTLTPGFTGANFLLGGYRAERAVPAAAAALEQTVNTSATCVRAIYNDTSSGPNQIGDINQYTIGTVLPNSVRSTGGVGQTLSDSTTLTGSTTHNGTAGVAAGPNLTGAIADPTTNAIAFVEDKQVGAVIDSTRFNIETAGGLTCNGIPGSASTSGNTVFVLFPAPGCPVAQAVRAGQVAGAVTAASDPGVANVDDQVVLPNAPNSGNTALPDLTSAKLEADGSAIDFTVNKAVSVVPAGAANFHADLSTGQVVNGTTASVIAASTTSTTIRVAFGANFSLFDEYVVKASFVAGAVQETSPPNLTNSFGSTAAGGNAGAFARGFTTGADVFGATINRSTGVVTVALDQRAFFSPTPANVILLDGSGLPVATATAPGIQFPTQAAGPQQVTVQFSPGQVSAASNIAVENSSSPPSAGGAAFDTIINVPNVSQILSPTFTSSSIRAAMLHHKKALSRKAIARKEASLREQAKARTAKLLHSRHHR